MEAKKDEEPKEVRYCYQTFVSSVESKTKLLRCSRCNSAYYVNQAAQKENWPFHKGRCQRPDEAYVEKMSLADLVTKCREWPEVDHNSALCFRRLKKCFQKCMNDRALDYYDKFEKEVGMGLFDIGFGLHKRLFHKKENVYVKIMSSFWATPGIPELLLNDPLTSVSRQQFIEIEQPNKPDARYSPKRDAGEYAYFLFNALVFSGIRNIQQTMMSIHDGNGALRTVPAWAIRARDRALDLYLSGAARKDCGDSFFPGLSMINTWMMDSHEKRMICINKGGLWLLFEETADDADSAEEYGRKFLSWLVQHKQKINEDITNQALCDIVYGLLIHTEKRYKREQEDEPFFENFMEILKVCLNESKKSEERWKYISENEPNYSLFCDIIGIDNKKAKRNEFLDFFIQDTSNDRNILLLSRRYHKKLISK